MTKAEYEDIYRLLDSVNPVPFDCGRICGAACCDIEGEDLGIYLFPGEEEVRGLDSWRNAEEDQGSYFVDCPGPEHCDRSLRPIQCRLFPFVPVIRENGEPILEIGSDELPYVCPLVEDKAQLDPKYIRVCTEVWDRLAKDPKIYEFVRNLTQYDEAEEQG